MPFDTILGDNIGQLREGGKDDERRKDKSEQQQTDEAVVVFDVQEFRTHIAKK